MAKSFPIDYDTQQDTYYKDSVMHVLKATRV
jgi:hypothetical protein